MIIIFEFKTNAWKHCAHRSTLLRKFVQTCNVLPAASSFKVKMQSESAVHEGPNISCESRSFLVIRQCKMPKRPPVISQLVMQALTC